MYHLSLSLLISNVKTVDALLEDIHFDIKVAHGSLARPAYAAYRDHAFLKPTVTRL